MSQASACGGTHVPYKSYKVNTFSVFLAVSNHHILLSFLRGLSFNYCLFSAELHFVPQDVKCIIPNRLLFQFSSSISPGIGVRFVSLFWTVYDRGKFSIFLLSPCIFLRTALEFTHLNFPFSEMQGILFSLWRWRCRTWDLGDPFRKGTIRKFFWSLQMWHVQQDHVWA
jgi:hypothetical protein